MSIVLQPPHEVTVGINGITTKLEQLNNRQILVIIDSCAARILKPKLTVLRKLCDEKKIPHCETKASNLMKLSQLYKTQRGRKAPKVNITVVMLTVEEDHHHAIKHLLKRLQ